MVAGHLIWYIETENGLFFSDGKEQNILDTLQCSREEFEKAWYHIMGQGLAALGPQNELRSWSATFVSPLMGRIEWV